jgi:hypothetical protein
VAFAASSLHRKPFWRHSCGSMGIVRLPRALSPRQSLQLRDTSNEVIPTTNMDGDWLQRQGRFGTLAPSQD